VYTLSTSKSTYHHGNLQAALVEAACALLHEGGTEALSLRAVARRAGVSAMAPYRHFADKDALLAAVAAAGFERFRATLAAADGSASDPADALVAQGVAYVRFACADPRLFKLMFGTAKPAGCPELSAAADAAYRVLAQRVATLVREGQQADLTLAAWSLVHGLASLVVDQQLPPASVPEELTVRISRLLLHGVESAR
jgi:AcrR family transcriptional regulator